MHMQEPVACQLHFLQAEDDVARCVPAGDNDARPDDLVNKCDLPHLLEIDGGSDRSVKLTNYSTEVVSEQLKPANNMQHEIIDWSSMIPCTHGTCTYVRRCRRLRAHALLRTDRLNYWRSAVRQTGCLVTRHGSSTDFQYVILSQP